MTQKRTKQLLPVLQAWAESKNIQVRDKTVPDDKWETFRSGACADFEKLNWEWRVEPEQREYVAVLYAQPGLVGGLYVSTEYAKEHNPGREIIRVKEVL